MEQLHACLVGGAAKADWQAAVADFTAKHKGGLGTCASYFCVRFHPSSKMCTSTSPDCSCSLRRCNACADAFEFADWKDEHKSAVIDSLVALLQGEDTSVAGEEKRAPPVPLFVSS